jgi:formylglycine-generating enzyme required for sulfatase activity
MSALYCPSSGTTSADAYVMVFPKRQFLPSLRPLRLGSINLIRTFLRPLRSGLINLVRTFLRPLRLGLINLIRPFVACALMGVSLSASAQSDRCHSLFGSSRQQGAINPDWLQELIALRQDIQKNDGALGVALRGEWQERVNQLSETDRRSLAEALRASSEKQNDRSNEEEARRRKAQAEIINVIDGTRAILHRVEPGAFKMGELGGQVDVTLTQPFDMMATPTTQIIWKKVAELVNSRLGNRFKINVDPSLHKGDTHPVERVSFDDIQIWLKGLNELSQSGEPLLFDLIPGHKKGDVYRLPTEAEWEFVVRGRGQYNDTYYFGNHKSQLGNYAWFEGNSGGQTQPVGQKEPLRIDGREFHDMLGNVLEYVQDWYGTKLLGGTDPKGPEGPETGRLHRVVRGGYYLSSHYFSSSGSRYRVPPTQAIHFTGFRFVRNAPLTSPE